jgi:hypothetical protein
MATNLQKSFPVTCQRVRRLLGGVKCLIPYLVCRLVERSGIQQVTCVVHEVVETAKCSDRGLHRFAYFWLLYNTNSDI